MDTHAFYTPMTSSLMSLVHVYITKQVKMETCFFYLLCVAGFFVAVFGYPNGLISDSCDTFLPKHGNSVPQTAASSYKITVSNNTFSPGDVIKVTLQSSSASRFKGFLLEARSVGGDRIIGAFTITDGNTQGLSCSAGPRSAVSHTNSNGKSIITTSWTAPVGAGPVRFRATVLESYSTFWSNVESEIIVALQISNTTCGSEKFCFSNPDSCSPDDSSCLFMSSVPSSNGYVFEMSGSTSGYLAIGFSDDQFMGNDDIYICTKNSIGKILVQGAYSIGKVTPTVRNTSTATSIVASYVNGVLKCSFIMQTSISTQARAGVTSSYYIFLGSGPSQADGQILKHARVPLISANKVDLSSFSATSAASRTSPVILGHGALMLIAWMTTGSIGMIMARYMKSAAKKPILGKDLWFQAHFFLMVLTVILTIIAFIMVFVEVADWSGGAHPVIGCIVMILTFLQPIGAMFRPSPKSKRRFIFNWGHGVNALVIKTLAVAAIFLGLQLLDTTHNQWMPKVMGGFLAWEALFFIILETNAHLKSKETYEDVDGKVQSETAALLIFICGNLVFLISLLVGIGNS
ncbi:putative ferric-chelate reductase 1 [Rhinophrynus dorsalis]